LALKAHPMSESFSSKLRDEFLHAEIFFTLKEVPVPAER
jgi:hypothetical protein